MATNAFFRGKIRREATSGHNRPQTCVFEATSGHNRPQTCGFQATSGHNRPQTCRNKARPCGFEATSGQLVWFRDCFVGACFSASPRRPSRSCAVHMFASLRDSKSGVEKSKQFWLRVCGPPLYCATDVVKRRQSKKKKAQIPVLWLALGLLFWGVFGHVFSILNLFGFLVP